MDCFGRTTNKRLLESELLQRVLLGVIDGVKPEALNGAVRRAVDVFLSGYERR